MIFLPEGIRTMNKKLLLKNCFYRKSKDTTLPLPSLVPLGVARLSPSSRYRRVQYEGASRVLHEAATEYRGPRLRAGGSPCPVGKPSS